MSQTEHLQHSSKNLFLLLASTFLFSIAAGIGFVSLPLIIYQKTGNSSLMGISSATEIFAGLIIAGFLHGLNKKFGICKTIIVFSLIDASIILIIPFYQNFMFWLLLIFISGMSWFGLVAFRQSWINLITSDIKRSKILGITSTVTYTGVAMGPAIVKIIGAGKYLNFLTSATLILSSGFILLFIKECNQTAEKSVSENKLFSVIKKNYRIFLTRFLLDFQTSVILIFTVTYGMAYNYSAEDAGLLISIYMFVGLFDFVIGFLINDKLYKKYFLFGFLGCLICIISLPFLIKYYYIALLIYLIYGFFVSLILINIISAANRNQKASDIVAINAALQYSASFGGVIGILTAGLLIQFLGSKAFIIVPVASGIIYLTINFLIKNEKN